jgi:hypothetical protein
MFSLLKDRRAVARRSLNRPDATGAVSANAENEGWELRASLKVSTRVNAGKWPLADAEKAHLKSSDTEKEPAEDDRA